MKESMDPEKETDLETQIDVYEEESNLDYRELSDRFASFNINIKYPIHFYLTNKFSLNNRELTSTMCTKL